MKKEIKEIVQMKGCKTHSFLRKSILCIFSRGGDSTMVKLMAFAGSTRNDSMNKKLVKNVANVVQATGVQVTYIDLKDYPLPLYDGDVESNEGIPEYAKKLKALMKQHDGFLIASPEYNSGISGVLKNVIDWTSRPEEGEPPLVCYKGKVAAIMSASPGSLGGLRGLYHLRYVLENVGVIVLPEQFALGNSYSAFDEKGALKENANQQSAEVLGTKIVEITKKLATLENPES